MIVGRPGEFFILCINYANKILVFPLVCVFYFSLLFRLSCMKWSSHFGLQPSQTGVSMSMSSFEWWNWTQVALQAFDFGFKHGFYRSPVFFSLPLTILIIKWNSKKSEENPSLIASFVCFKLVEDWNLHAYSVWMKFSQVHRSWFFHRKLNQNS